MGSLATDANQHTFFVDPVNGHDDADGQTSGRAWESLQHGLDQLRAGDTLYLMSGEYRGALHPGTSHFLEENSGTDQAWIRVAAAPGQEPVVMADAGNAIEVRGDYVEVSGLRIKGETFGVGNDYGWGLLTRGNHDVRFAGNTISGMPVGGITSVEATNLEFAGNTVFGNSFWGPDQGSGISLWNSRDAGTDPGADGYHDRIIGNIVYGNENKVSSQWRQDKIITDGNGIIVDSTKQLGYTGRILIANNLVFDNGGRGVLVLDSSRVDVTHNSTYRNSRTDGIEGGPAEIAVGGSNDVHVTNNLAWSRPGAPTLISHGSKGVVSGGNAFVTDVAPELHSPEDIVVDADPGIANATADPSTADFRPRAGSVLLGRALATDPYVAHDADAVPRPAFGATIGAYEYQP